MNGSRYVKIALFFIVLGIAGGAYIIISADGLSDFNTRMYEVVLSDATGLSTRSKIYLAGVAVGRVRNVTLGNNEALLKVAFLREIQIHENGSLSRKASSILGTSVLTLDPGSDPSPIIEPGGRIKAAKEARDLNALMGTVGDLGGQISQLIKDFQENQLALLTISLETFNSFARKVDAQSNDELERISRILQSLASITERTERLLVQGEINGTGPAGDVYGTLENLRMITNEIRQGQGNIGQVIYDDQLYASTLAALQRIEDAVAQFQTTLDTVNTVAASAGEVIDNANVIVERATGLGIQVDTSGSYNVLAKGVRAGASIRLNPASGDRWYRIGVSSIPGGVTSRTVKETIDSSGTHIEDITETRYSFAVDAEIARRFGIMTVRGGLLENTAGFGLDIQPIQWASLSGELFNFKTGEAPNLRGTLTLFPFFDPDSNKLWNWIYLQGGITNSLSDRRDYFVGGGLRFADQEVKGMVGLLPAFN
jgi:phospholipid/cholesterol/gamma-HCH transport system substrate-binding protein